MCSHRAEWNENQEKQTVRTNAAYQKERSVAVVLVKRSGKMHKKYSPKESVLSKNIKVKNKKK